MSIFAKKVTILLKNGKRFDYTHVVQFSIHDSGTKLYILGEGYDKLGICTNIAKWFAIKDIHITIIDWHIPPR